MLDLPVRAPAGWFFLGIFTPYFYDWARSRTKAEDESLFLLELADLLRLGVPVAEAVSEIVRVRRRSFGHRYSEFTQSLLTLNENLQRGASLSNAVFASPGIPDGWGELLDFVEEPEELADLLEGLSVGGSGGFSLPLVSMLRIQVMVPFSIGIAMFLAQFIFPTFVELFRGMKLTLPWATRILVLCTNSWNLVWQIPLILVLLIVIASTRSGAARSLVWQVLFWVPGFKSVVRLHSQGQTYGLLAAGLRAGVPLEACIDGAAQVVSLIPYRRYLQELQVTDGTRLSDAFAQEPGLFDPQVSWLLKQGEELEDLPTALTAAAEICRVRLGDLGKRAVVTLDIMSVCLIGAFVGFVVVSVWLPLYQLISEMAR